MQLQTPCYKLGIKFERMDIVKKFMMTFLTGIYFKVLQECEVESNDKIELVYQDRNNITINDIVHLYMSNNCDDGDIETMERATRMGALP